MSDHVIAPPPSLEEILSQEERIGTVDFSRRLVAVPEPQAPGDERAAAAPQPPATPAAAQAEEDPDVKGDDRELVSVGGASSSTSVQVPADGPDRSGGQAPSRGRGKGGKQRGRGARSTDADAQAGGAPAAETPDRSEQRPEAVTTADPEPTEAGVHAAADRETVGRLTDPASIAWLTRAPGPAGAEDRRDDGAEQDADDFLVAPPGGFVPGSETGPAAQAAALLSLVPAEDLATVTEDVDDVVAGVVARIQQVRSATIAHLEAIEIEAAMRCEMLTAQAELDAELIRLHARREAHAIIAAARARSGLPPVVTEDAARLDRLEAASARLVDTLEEQDLPSGPPDHEPRT